MAKKKAPGDTRNAILRALPAVQELLSEPALAKLVERIARPLVIAAIQAEIASARSRILTNGIDVGKAKALVAGIPAAVRARLEREAKPSPEPVINATGVVLHTNLGRAPLAPEALEAVVAVAKGYSTLEYDLEKGERGSRQSHVEALLCKALGTEAAIVVNNNAAGVMLVLAALAAGREVVVSRGELVEIGGSFRVPDILRASGARLVEVGTTNRTHLADYRAAIGDETALLLKVHTSNFRVVGFTAEVSETELAALARERKLPFVADVGSGMLVDLARDGVTGEPSPARIAAVADVITFSGDKLLGGPQAGIVAGKAALLAKIRKHPFARAVRIDKMSLAALVATVRLAIDPERASSIPAIRMLREPLDAVRARAERLAAAIRSGAPHLSLSVEPSEATFGGGSVPGQSLPSFAVRIVSSSPDALATALRAQTPPVIVRVQEGALWMDARTIADGEVAAAAKALVESAQ